MTHGAELTALNARSDRAMVAGMDAVLTERKPAPMYGLYDVLAAASNRPDSVDWLPGMLTIWLENEPAPNTADAPEDEDEYRTPYQ